MRPEAPDKAVDNFHTTGITSEESIYNQEYCIQSGFLNTKSYQGCLCKLCSPGSVLDSTKFPDKVNIPTRPTTLDSFPQSLDNNHRTVQLKIGFI